MLITTFGYSQKNNRVEVSLTLSIPAIALIDFVADEGQMITYSYAPLESKFVEQVITPTIGDQTWINYSSIVNLGQTNYITVHISSGSLPADVLLSVLVSADAGAGSGATGRPVGQIRLSKYPQNIINSIGSCYTGRGIHKGHKLTYIWENPDSYNYSLNYENGKAIAVTYTITSND